MGINEAYGKFTRKNKKQFGNKIEYSVCCKKGNFSVYAPTQEEAEREAMHYFVQYYEDGDYNE